MLESKIERDFTKWVKGHGGLCLKQNANWYIGIPDRLIIMPGGRCMFLEMKRPGGKTSDRQEARIRSLRRRRIPVYTASSLEEAKAACRATFGLKESDE